MTYNLHSVNKYSVFFNLCANNPIHIHNSWANNQMSILCLNGFKTKYCVFHNAMIAWNYLPDV